MNFVFLYVQNMVNFEAFGWFFSSSTNPQFGRSDSSIVCELCDLIDYYGPLNHLKINDKSTWFQGLHCCAKYVFLTEKKFYGRNKSENITSSLYYIYHNYDTSC